MIPISQARYLSANRPGVLWSVWAVSLLALIATAGSIGGPQGPFIALVVVLETVLHSGWPAAVFLVTAWGFGEICSRFAEGIVRPVRFALGLAALLTVSHVLGSLGLLNALTTVGLSIVGVIGVVWSLTRHGAPRRRGPAGWLWVSLPALALMLTAASSPPGALWSSEYNGYDVLSYHLQLPREWLELGSTLPLKHNVYSFLPGSLETAYAYLGWLSGASASPGEGLLAGEGWRLMSAQFLHSGLAIASGWIVARLARRLAAASGFGPRRARVVSAVAGGLVLSTPWVIVLGSMAYNEMGMMAIGSGAMLAACRRSPRPSVQTALVGALVGVACCVKPTALLFVGIPAGVLLLRFQSWRWWSNIVVVGSVAGVLAMSPWLVRNAVMTGNPVFPLATEVFGTGHWTHDQAARFSMAHTFDGSLSDRLRLAVWTDPAAEENANPVERWRGMSNLQWFLAFPVGLLGGLLMRSGIRARRISAGLLLSLAGQLAAWLFATHLQSRFLIPCLLTLAPLAGLGLGRLGARWGLMLGVVVCLAQAGASWSIFSGERGGEPNALLVGGPMLLLGDPYSREVGEVSPVAYINHELPRGAVVVLLGGATPLYFERPVRYTTVWDRLSVIGSIPDGDHKALPAWRDAAYVLIDHGELSRQRASGYLDPMMSHTFISRLTTGLVPIHPWPRLGQFLFRVPKEKNP